MTGNELKTEYRRRWVTSRARLRPPGVDRMDEGTFDEDYGQRVKLARTTARMTQTELGVALNLSRSSVANIEAGRQRCSAEQVVHLATAMGCDPHWLLTGPPSGLAPQTLVVSISEVRHVAENLRALTDRLESLSASGGSIGDSAQRAGREGSTPEES